jgi:hypothetical protein
MTGERNDPSVGVVLENLGEVAQWSFQALKTFLAQKMTERYKLFHRQHMWPLL